MLQQHRQDMAVAVEMAVGPADDPDFADAQHGAPGAERPASSGGGLAGPCGRAFGLAARPWAGRPSSGALDGLEFLPEAAGSRR
ncbi:MAG: hypothetical protein MZV70_40745 [Desulfobacterales bacterium]|nr:hypothetical protein [Desulfobacterales bacterium]